MINDESKLISQTLIIVIPFFILTGIYIILNGHISPGGGFQGGAVLASVFMCKYLISPLKDISLDIFHALEKVILLFIILLSLSFMTLGFKFFNLISNENYLLIMNLLIGIKVTCGMTIIFYRFIFYEDR